MTQQEVIDLLETTKSEEEWNKACDKVKKAHNGQYPDWWYAEIMMSGLFRKISSQWKNN